MAMQTIQKFGTFTGAAAAQNLDLGFVPDYFQAWGRTTTAGQIVGVKWQSTMPAASAMIDLVILDNGSATAKNLAQITANGLTIWYKSGGATVDVPVVKRWTASTTWVAGDIVRPVTVPAGFVSAPMFKCTTAGAGGASEPTWVTTVGQTTTDSSATWTCVDTGLVGTSEQKMITGQGLTIGTAAQTNTVVYDYMAIGREAV
jgi:hypothetical protein